MPAIGHSAAVDFSNLSDEELEQMLRDYGVDVGPINAATRRTYERKLSKLKTGQTSPPIRNYEPVDDDEDEEDDEIQVRQPASRSPVYDYSQPRVRPGASRITPPRVDARSSLSSARKMTTLSSTPPGRSHPKAQAESKGIPLWVKLLMLIVVLVLVYLVYVNMEPQAVSNIPTIQGKVEV